MPNEDTILFGTHEYRSQGGEIHRRPKEREGLSPWNAAWLVMRKDETDESKMIPGVVLAHFNRQHADRIAVD